MNNFTIFNNQLLDLFGFSFYSSRWTEGKWVVMTRSKVQHIVKKYDRRQETLKKDKMLRTLVTSNSCPLKDKLGRLEFRSFNKLSSLTKLNIIYYWYAELVSWCKHEFLQKVKNVNASVDPNSIAYCYLMTLL